MGKKTDSAKTGSFHGTGPSIEKEAVQPDLKKLEDRIQYQFLDPSFLKHALVHPSYSGEMRWDRERSNQRLEFLGDAVLELIISEHLYLTNPKLEEGELTRKRASLVYEAALCRCAQDIGLGEYLFLGKGEDGSGGRRKPSILSDAFEALIGAIFLDGGFSAAKAFITAFLISDIGGMEEEELLDDAKSRLQEHVQQYGGTLFYETVSLESPAHKKEFRSGLYLDGKQIAEGEGLSKKRAEQEAARKALLFLKLNPIKFK